MLAAQGVEISVTNRALDWIGELGYDPQFGARPLKRAIQRELLNPLSKSILAGEVTADSTIRVELSDKKEFIFKNDATK